MTPATVEAWPPPPRHLLTVLLLVSSLTVMASATIAPSLPGLVDHFRGEPGVDTLVRLILTVPGIGIAVAAPLIGWGADRIGRRWIIVAGVGLYVVAGGAGLVLDSIGGLIASRLCVGIAVAGLLPTATALIADFWQGAARDRAFGVQAAFMAAGGVVFLPLGGLLAEWHWRGPFLVYLMPLALLPFVIAVIRDAPPRPAPAADSTDAGPFPLLLTAAICVSAFVAMTLFYALPVQLPFHLRELGQPAPWVAGASLAVAMGLSAAGSMSFRAVRRRAAPGPILAGSYAAIAAGYTLIALADGPGLVIAGLCLCGPGLGLLFPALSTWLMGAAPARYRARASGCLTTAVFLGQFLSPVFSQPVVVAYSLSAMFAAGAAVAIGFALLLAALSLLLPTAAAAEG